MSCPVSYTATSVGLASLSVLETLAAKGPLVDSPIFSAAEWHAKVFQLVKRNIKKQPYNDKLFNSRLQHRKNSCVYFMLLLVGAHATRTALAQEATATMTDGHNFSPPRQQQELAQSCSEWHPGLRANPIPSLCHRNATSSHPPPCFPELH